MGRAGRIFAISMSATAMPSPSSAIQNAGGRRWEVKRRAIARRGARPINHIPLEREARICPSALTTLHAEVAGDVTDSSVVLTAGIGVRGID